jgi:Tfp pilus assembly protein PilN
MRYKILLQINSARISVVKCWLKNNTWIVGGTKTITLASEFNTEFLRGQIHNLLKAFKFGAGEIVLILSRRLAVSRQIKVPSRDENEIKNMIVFWAPRCLPYPLEELVTSYSFLGKEEEGYSYLNLNVIHRDEIKRWLDVLNPWHNRVSLIMLSSDGLSAWANKLIKTGDFAAAAVLALEDTSAEMIITADNHLLFSRVFDFTNPQNLLDEINKTMEVYQRESINPQPTRMIVTGGNCEEIKKIMIQAGYKENIQTVAADSPVISGALKINGGSFNLLPPEVQETKKQNLIYNQLRSISFSVIALLIIIIVLIGLKFYRQTIYLNQLKSNLSVIIDEAKELRTMKNQLDVLQRKNLTSGKAVEIISELYKILPEQVLLTAVHYNHAGSLNFRGTAPETIIVLGIIPLLEKSDIFSRGKVRYVTKRKIDNKEIVEFEIEAQPKR